jgi:hypothetical protein
MRYRITDLETVGLDDAATWFDPCEPDAALLEPIEPDSRLKDPIKVAANLAEVERRRAARPAEIAANIAEKEAARAAKFSLDADTCKIVALGWHDIGYGSPIVRVCRTEDEERAALIEYWTTLQQQFTKIVGFNSARFDLVVLVMRSIYLKVPRPELVIAPAWKSPHIDLYEKLSLGGARDRKDVKGLRWYAKRLGIPIYDDISGADVAAMVKAGEWEKVQNHCLFDLDLTRAVGEGIGELEPQPVGAPF